MIPFISIQRNYFTVTENKLTQKYHSLADAELLRSCLKDMEYNLKHYGISFEGRSLPVSLNPNILLKSEVDKVAEASTLIYTVLNTIIRKFVEWTNGMSPSQRQYFAAKTR